MEARVRNFVVFVVGAIFAYVFLLGAINRKTEIDLTRDYLILWLPILVTCVVGVGMLLWADRVLKKSRRSEIECYICRRELQGNQRRRPIDMRGFCPECIEQIASGRSVRQILVAEYWKFGVMTLMATALCWTAAALLLSLPTVLLPPGPLTKVSGICQSKKYVEGSSGGGRSRRGRSSRVYIQCRTEHSLEDLKVNGFMWSYLKPLEVGDSFYAIVTPSGSIYELGKEDGPLFTESELRSAYRFRELMEVGVILSASLVLPFWLYRILRSARRRMEDLSESLQDARLSQDKSR